LRACYIEPVTYRIIYSLRFELEPLSGDPPEGSRFVTVPLNHDGTSGSRNGRPRNKARTIDLRVGDEMMCCGRWARIKAIEAVSENWMPDHEAETHTGHGYAYLLKGEMRSPEQIRAERHHSIATGVFSERDIVCGIRDDGQRVE
jgi:hypothetical protein